MINLKNILKGQVNEAVTLGDCYQAAGRLITALNDDKATLVHGMVNGQGDLEGKRFGHAWVETNGTVLDHSNGRKLEIPKSVYYALGGIDPKDNKYYSTEDALTWTLKSKHWGPWEMTGDVVSLTNEEIPDESREVGKTKMRLSRSEIDTVKQTLGEI